MPLTTVPADSQRGPVWTTYGMMGHKGRATGVSAAGSAAWPTAATAILVPFSVGIPTTFAEIFFMSGTAPGTANFDLGIYTDTFNLIKSIGATAAVNTAAIPQPSGGGAFSTPVTLMPGRYYIAMSAAATSITVHAASVVNGQARALGCLSMATAHPLPTTVTPAAATAVLPFLGLTTITNIL